MLPVIRIAKAVITPFDIAFKPICEGIKERADRLERAINAATQEGKGRSFFYSEFMKTAFSLGKH